MKFFKRYLFGFILIVCNTNCTNSLLAQNDKDYQDFKSRFDSNFVNQFPELVKSEIMFTSSKMDIKKNNVGLYLYEYDVAKKNLDSLERVFIHSKIATRYNSYDTCLLVVNRFETKYTVDYPELPIIKDSSLLDRDCYKNLMPIPNFLDYDGNNVTTCGLDSTFTIYVLEAKAGIYFKEFNLSPFSHMPKKWENGYSKGIAISKKNGTVIYWSVVW